MRKAWLNVLLVVVSVALGTVTAEFVARFLDTESDSGPATRHLDEIALAPGVDRPWFFADPPSLPNRRAVPREWLDLVHKVEQSGVTDGTRRADMFKAWNGAVADNPVGATHRSATATSSGWPRSRTASSRNTRAHMSWPSSTWRV